MIGTESASLRLEIQQPVGARQIEQQHLPVVQFALKGRRVYMAKHLKSESAESISSS